MKQLQNNTTHLSQQHRDFLSLLGYTYLKSNKLEKAIVVYQALYHLCPESECFSFCLSYLYLQKKQYEKAMFYAEIYLSNNKRVLKLGHLIKSEALYNLGRSSEAQECAKFFIQP